MAGWTLVLGSSFLGVSTRAEDCRETLPRQIHWEGVQDPIGDPGIAGLFVEAYDLYPRPLQDFMCEVSSFELYKANSGVSASSDMRFRSGPFEGRVTLDRWATWKDQLNFNVPNDNSFQNRADAARVEVDGRLRNTTFLYFLLAHELAHNVRRTEEQLDSWRYLYSAPEHWFSFGNAVCAYWCNGNNGIGVDRTEEVYEELFNRSSLLSLYSARNGEEAFADSFAFYVMTQVSGYTYNVVLPSGTRYEVGAKMRTPMYAERLGVLESVYRGLTRGAGERVSGTYSPQFKD